MPVDARDARPVSLHRATGHLAANQLSNEILFNIFVLSADHLRGSNGDGENGDRVYIEISGFERKGLGWTKLMLVCRRWRDVAVATPALWRTIDVARTSSTE
ncbi:hypothetical protein GSI_13167 [Ganoderma sinense ZZ0214-1]|uniref:F-box domain-containing protein n=1 Tax=Ganoderma sinense ZZ0214-1 TaxID=1077348 RepID=A0A2G8RVC3_9APHY|nr:hypothetical protein GSI_13167 [Ganoderma sinense ZZ0214-1]